MHLVILLLAVIALFLYLALGVRKDPDKRYFLYLYALIVIWLTAVFLYLLVTALSA